MNPFKSGPAAMKVVSEINKFNRKGDGIKAALRNEEYGKALEMIRTAEKQCVDGISDKLKIEYEVTGKENLPENGPVIVYSNHQGLADILAVIHTISNSFQIGFVSKEEWKKVGVLARAIENTGSVFLKRDDPREALEVAQTVAEMTAKGFSFAIFPEGTRSQGHEPGEFKAGALKFAQKAGVPVIPITIDGSYRLWEEDGNYKPCTIKVKIHPVVHIEEMGRKEQKEAFAEIERTIVSALEE